MKCTTATDEQSVYSTTLPTVYVHMCQLFSVNIETESLSAISFDFLVETLNDLDKSQVKAYIFKKDKERALFSRLLQKFVTRNQFKTNTFEIKRTREVFISYYFL